MARKNRRDQVHALVPHHVWNRGNNQRSLFSQAPDYARFIMLMADAKAKYRVQIHSVVLMTNHFHFVITPLEPHTLSKFMASISQRWAQIRNGAKLSSGTLWEGRFKSKAILTESQVAATAQYIELNPVRAGIVKDPSLYPWSTFGCNGGGGNGKFPSRLWTPLPWYLELGATPAERQRRYAEFVREIQASGRRPDGFEQLDAKEALVQMTRRKIRVRRPTRKRAPVTELRKLRTRPDS